MPTYRITGLNDLKMLKKNGSAITKIDLHFAKTAEFSPVEEEIEYDGDGQLVKKFYLSGLDIEIEADSYDVEAAASVAGITPVTTISGVAKRWYFGSNTDSSGVKCGVECTALAEDVDTGATVEIRVVAPVGTMSALTPPALASRDKSPMKLKFSADKTAVDIAGVALASAPSDGCFWYVEELAAA